MKIYIGRHNDLKNRLNNHLKRLTGLDKDFISNFKQSDFLDLKMVLKDINNLLTLKMTISAAYWLCDFFNIDTLQKELILNKVDSTKPNTNGFDIHIIDPQKIIAEVKCILPINNGERYGDAQWYSILDDAIKLKSGKKELSDTSNYLKFLFLIDLGDRTNQAITKLLRQSRRASDRPSRSSQHKIKEQILLLNESHNYKNLSTDIIYIKSIKMD